MLVSIWWVVKIEEEVRGGGRGGGAEDKGGGRGKGRRLDKTWDVGIGGGLETEEEEMRYETKEEVNKHDREEENEGVEGWRRKQILTWKEEAGTKVVEENENEADEEEEEQGEEEE